MSAVEPVINEFMASNTSGIMDEDGVRSDWIEIYNPGSLPVNMQGWHLTDDPFNPNQFTFPSTVINPGGYLIVFASGNDRAVAGSELHAQFRLNGDGDYLALLRPDGTASTVFDPFPAQLNNVSYGFASGATTSTTPIASGAAAKYLIPTSGTANNWMAEDFVDTSWNSATTGIGFSPAGNAPRPRETEPNNSTAGPNSAVFNFEPSGSNLYHLGLSGVATVNASIINDDWFKIGKLGPGDVLTLAASGSPSGRAGGSTNVNLELWRDGQATAVISDADGGPGADALINRFGITATDTYYVRVRAGATSVLTANYQLGAWLENSGANPLTGGSTTAETEANDTRPAANDISTSWRAVQYLSRTAGTISPNTDIDVYQYSLTAGDLLTVHLDSTSTLDARIFLLNSSGTPIATEDGSSAGAGTDSSIYSFIIPSTGTYYLQVAPTSTATNATGTYNADVYLSSATAPPAPTSLTTLIGTNIDAEMRNNNASAYMRIPFSSADPSSIGTMLLRIKYNDGFVAYLNGTKVAERNAPLSLAFNSAATGSRSTANSSIFETIDITAFKSLLNDTLPNVLAIHGLNNSAADTQFLVLPELVFSNFTPGAVQYMTSSTPGRNNLAGAQGAVADTQFSVDRGFHDQPFQLTITSDTTDAQIRYTLDGSVPTATTGFVYNGPITVGPALHGTPGGPAKPGAITVRAAAFKTGWIPTNVDTQTYIFLDQVITQNAAGLPVTWGGTGSGNTIMTPPGPDYAFDQTIINANMATIKDDLKSLPTVNISMPLNDWFGAGGVGIYPSGIGVGKAMSMEYFDSTGTESFQVNGSVQIIGGGEGGTSAQRWKSYKLSMRLKFKEAFGDPNLDFPLFGPDAADSFDTLVLDAQINNTWLHPTSAQQRLNAMLIHDQFISDIQNAMSGGPGHGPQGKFVHLYLNGLYWGVYDLHERPDEHFGVAYNGGEEVDWDVISHTKANPSNGDAMAVANFQTMLNRTAADMSNPTNYALVEEVLDIDDFIDYMLANFYGGNTDWSHKNWYATHNRVDPTDKWRFHSWDAEHVFHQGQGGTLAPNFDVTGDNDPDSPTAMHQRLALNPEYKMRFADRMQKHFFNGGALTPEATAALYQARMDEVDRAMVLESARWGDNRQAGNSYTQAQWAAYQQRLLSEYFPVRTGNVLTQLRNRGLFPFVDAPTFSSYGGAFSGPQSLTITGGGTVYYTLDGSDPRLPGGAVSPSALIYSGPINVNQSMKVQARVFDGSTWSALEDAIFHIGPAPAIRVSEIMYHPREGPSPLVPADDFEYIELVNTGGSTINLSGIQFTKGITATFTSGALAPGTRILLVRNQAAFESRYGTGRPIGGIFTGALSDSGETLRLETGLGQEIQEFRYSDNWYPHTDGDGFSLVAVNPSASNLALSEKEAWRPSEPLDGGPGVADPGIAPGSIVINEIQSRPTVSGTDWIELYNTTNDDINIGGWALSDSAGNLTKYIIQPGTIIRGNDYLVFDEATSFGVAGNPGVNVQFDFSRFQDQAYLTQRVGGVVAGYRDSLDFGAADLGVSFGRFVKSTGAKDFVPMSAPTKLAANAYPRVGPIVINEVMYHPAMGGTEYLELKNISDSPVTLYDAALNAGWSLTNGIGYTFGSSDVIPAGGYALLVPTTPAAFRAAHNIPANIPIFGPYTGQLNNGGEQVELSRPAGLDGSGAQTFIMVDRLTYNNLAPWPAASGNGAALGRKGLKKYTNDVANWQATSAGGTPGAPNAHILTGVSGADAYHIRIGPGNVTQVYRNDPTFSGPPLFVFEGDNLDQLLINAGGGNDSLTINLPGGVGLPASLVFNGDIGDETITINSPTSAATPIHLNVGTGINTLNVAAGQILASLTIGASGRVNLPAGGKSLKVNNLSLGAGATLNLTDNDLVVQADAATWQQALQNISGLVGTGRNGGAWTGAGITSSTAAANSLRVTGLATIANRTGGGSALYSTFNGQSVDEYSILVKYSYVGDANADGKLDADDYALIDAGYASAATGYGNGDFDYSGLIDADDYFWIDRAHFNQGAPLSSTPTAQPASSTTTTTSTSSSTQKTKKKRVAVKKAAHHRRVPRLVPNERFYRR